MAFDSVQYLLFFPTVVLLYFLLPGTLRLPLLLIASYIFYMSWEIGYILLIFFSTVSTYVGAIGIAGTDSKLRKRLCLGGILAFNLGVLFTFKYFNFFSENAIILIRIFEPDMLPPMHQLLLPVGISFYTFQLLSYALDVYGGKIAVERNFIRFALFGSFFPQLVAGPIERSHQLMPQLHEKHHFAFENAVIGLNRIALGLFKKLVIADRLAIYVDSVYADTSPDGFGATFTLVCASVFFALQIYADFSAYSDIAIGTARLLGIRLVENFDRPFMSKSVTEFWRRWHISLGTWLRDYLFTPLNIALRNFGQWGIVLALLVTFLLCGIWHGANWTFIIFGLLHGILLSYEAVTRKFRKRLLRPLPPIIGDNLARLFVFAFFVVTSIFFRAQDMSQATEIFQNMFTNFAINKTLLFGGMGPFNFLLCLMAVGFLIVSDFIPKEISARWSGLYLGFICVLIILFGVSGADPFIYFQF